MSSKTSVEEKDRETIEMVRHEPRPTRIDQIEFGLFSGSDMKRLSSLNVRNNDFYEMGTRTPAKNGCLDPRLGVSNGQMRCMTCNKFVKDCCGHFGTIELALPVFHIGYFNSIKDTLSMICKECSRVLLEPGNREIFSKEIKDVTRSNSIHSRQYLQKKILKHCKLVKTCPYCFALNGPVKKVTSAKGPHLIHAVWELASKSKKYQPLLNEFHDDLYEASQHNAEIEQYVSKAQHDLNPSVVLDLFKKIPNEDLRFLQSKVTSRPEDMLLTQVLVPPVCIRPSVTMQAGASSEDDLTMLVQFIIEANDSLRDNIRKGASAKIVKDAWDHLSINVSTFFNGAYSANKLKNSKPSRGLCQRLKGKQGRFRHNLSGKRVDFSGRTVISPDPNLDVHQVAVPESVAKILTYPERVTEANIEKLRLAVRNGPHKWPGAKTVHSVARQRILNLDAIDSTKIAPIVKVGDMVERHLIDGDVVLFNRQPSLHKMSIMAHRVKVMPWRTFRFNECVCNPYNADFDGDEMNLHVPQTEEARAEAACLMDVRKNLITPKDGAALVSATQDFLTASYLLTQRDMFMTKEEFCTACTYATDAKAHIDLPRPAVMYPVQLWTGKQLFSVLLQNALNGESVSVELKEKNFEPPSDETALDVMCPRDGFVVIKNSEHLSGNLCKTTLGSSKKGLVFALARDVNEATAARFLGMMTKSFTRWLTNFGFSIGIDDVTPSEDLKQFKRSLIQERYVKCTENIEKYHAKTLQLHPGCNEEESLEAELSSILNKVREKCGDELMRTLPKHNATLCMATCGSKGSPLNICQMMAAVGQQIVNGERVAEGYVERTLPHFERNDKTPEAKGFVASSFYDGLSATEFFFHTQGGREGLVDTAVKTAETGYMQRRLTKALEDLSLRYDGTVRTSTKSIVQFEYGDDGLNPSFMESNSRPVNFDRLLQCAARKPSDKILTPSEVLKISNDFKKSEKIRMLYKNNDKIRNEIDSFVKRLQERLSKAPEKIWKKIARGKVKTEEELLLRNTDALTRQQLESVFEKAAFKYTMSHQEPGEAVGAISAMSIGEPATQMTLKTFHFSGVASMNVTLGVRGWCSSVVFEREAREFLFSRSLYDFHFQFKPFEYLHTTTTQVPRVKEIINAVETISTQIITANLLSKDERSARIVKARVERTLLGEVCTCIREVVKPGEGFFISIKLDKKRIQDLLLDIDVEKVIDCILKDKRLKLPKEGCVVEAGTEEDSEIQILLKNIEGIVGVQRNTTKTKVLWKASKVKERPKYDEDTPNWKTMFYNSKILRQILPDVLVGGSGTVKRAVISKPDNGDGHILCIEGTDLLAVMNAVGVDHKRTTTNHIIETERVLGIEAARKTIMKEITTTYDAYGIDVDYRHLNLLASTMTYKGKILGITRFGISKMKDSVLMLASFEKTTDHLFNAAVHGRVDKIEGVSECIIMGIPIPVGTGSTDLIHDKGMSKSDDDDDDLKLIKRRDVTLSSASLEYLTNEWK